MENASKALLIAGAILICILLIAIGMYIYNSAQGTIQTAAGQMGQQDKEMYNAMIRKYLGNSKKGTDIKQMIEDIINQNNQYVNESGKFISIHVVNDEGSGFYGVDGYTATNLDTVTKNANVYEKKDAENNQANIDAATKEYRELKKKISAGRNYIVSEKTADGIIYAVDIGQVSKGAN